MLFFLESKQFIRLYVHLHFKGNLISIFRHEFRRFDCTNFYKPLGDTVPKKRFITVLGRGENRWLYLCHHNTSKMFKIAFDVLKN